MVSCVRAAGLFGGAGLLLLVLRGVLQKSMSAEASTTSSAPGSASGSA
jgi:hypothetical protein